MQENVFCFSLSLCTHVWLVVICSMYSMQHAACAWYLGWLSYLSGKSRTKQWHIRQIISLVSWPTVVLGTWQMQQLTRFWLVLKAGRTGGLRFLYVPQTILPLLTSVIPQVTFKDGLRMVGAVMSGHMTKPGKVSPFYCCQEDVFFSVSASEVSHR